MVMLMPSEIREQTTLPHPRPPIRLSSTSDSLKAALKLVKGLTPEGTPSLDLL